MELSSESGLGEADAVWAEWGLNLVNTPLRMLLQ